ncbi:formin-like protein 6 isoform X1 [Iris pallida]|uniref:Formin-like protein 6 isoform X1 n=1 Tax=Iris pallida TaxID=29817 RepID=A0AAX6H6P6_IRIPA|nr:formin-like protein 6 isoform X1 [Iris pallida]
MLASRPERYASLQLCASGGFVAYIFLLKIVITWRRAHHGGCSLYSIY